MEKKEVTASTTIITSDNAYSPVERSKEPFKTYLYTVGLCYNGEGTVSVGAKEYRLQKGCLLTIGPGISAQWRNGEGCLMDTLMFYEDLFLNTFNSTFFYSLEFFCPDAHNMIILGPKEFIQMQHLFEAVHLVEEKPDVVPGILFSILKLAQKQYWQQYSFNKKELTAKERVTANFRELVAKHFSEHKDVLFYANALHLTPKYLTEVLQFTTGMSAKKWIDHHVMQEAKYLLVHKGLSIKEVGFRLGYVDASHFVKSFKKHEKELPGVFKEKMTNVLLS